MSEDISQLPNLDPEFQVETFLPQALDVSQKILRDIVSSPSLPATLIPIHVTETGSIVPFDSVRDKEKLNNHTFAFKDRVRRAAAIIDDLPDATEGLNLERVHRFIASLGLRVAPYKVVESEDLAKLPLWVSRTMSDIHNGVSGAYMPSTDRVLTERVHDKEQGARADILNERFLVHELAHGSAEKRTNVLGLETGSFEDAKIKSISGRAGNITYNREHSTEARGKFWEEAFAGYVEGLYNVHVTGKPYGTYEGSNRTVDNEYYVTHTGEFVGIAKKYLFITPGSYDQRGCSPSSFAAMGIDLIASANPDFFQIMLDARSGEAKDIRKFIASIDEVSPGLYEATRKLPYTQVGFETGLLVIQKRLAL